MTAKTVIEKDMFAPITPISTMGPNSVTYRTVYSMCFVCPRELFRLIFDVNCLIYNAFFI